MNPIRFDAQGLVPVVVQSAGSGEVLMLAYMNRDALQETFRTGLMHFWSRSRRTLWLKGATSGNLLRLEELRVNCEANSLLARVRPEGPACHDGYESCYYRRLDESGETTVVAPRLFDPTRVYGDTGDA